MITDKELHKLQELAKLNFTEKEFKDFSHKLRNVMDMIDLLQDVDCSSVEPLRSVCNMNQRMVKDEATIHDISNDLFKNIPNSDKSENEESSKSAEFAKEVKCFVVPKVIE